MQNRRSIVSLAISTLVVVVAIACNSSVPVNPPRAPGVAVLEIYPDIESIQLTDVAQTVGLAVVARNAVGEPVRGVHVLWESMDSDVAVVTQNGSIRAVAAGSTRVSVSAGDVRDEVDVIVTTPVSMTVRVNEPTILGSGVQVETPYGKSQLDGEGLGRVEVSLSSPTLVTARTGDGTVLLAAAPITGFDGVLSEQSEGEIEISFRSTAEALLLDHPLLRTNDARVFQTLRAVIASDFATDNLANLLRSNGGVGNEALLSGAVQSGLLHAAFDVAERVIATLERQTLVSASYPTPGSVDAESLTGVLKTTTFYPELRGPRTGAPIGKGVDFHVRLLEVDASAYSSRGNMYASASGRQTMQLVANAYDQHGLVPSNSATRLLTADFALDQIGKAAARWVNLDLGGLELTNNTAYLVVATSPGYGAGRDRQEIESDYEWIQRMPPQVAGDLRYVRWVNIMGLVFDAFTLVTDWNLKQGEIGDIVEETATGAVPTSLQKLFEETFACTRDVEQALDIIRSDLQADLEMATQRFFECLELATASITVTAPLLRSYLLPWSSDETRFRTLSDIKQLGASFLQNSSHLGKILDLISAVGSAVHRVYDMNSLTPLEVSVLNVGDPAFAVNDGEPEFDPIAQFFLKPSTQITTEDRVTIDATNSADPDGGDIVEYIIEDGMGGRYVNDYGIVSNLRYPYVGEYEVCVSVTDDEGVTSSDTCDMIMVSAPPHAIGPDLQIFDYRIDGVRMGSANFQVFNLEQYETLDLEVMWRNLGTEPIAHGVDFNVGVYVDGERAKRKSYVGEFGYGAGDDWDLDLGPFTPGSYTITIWADYNDTVKETNETNNTRSFNIRVDPAPNEGPRAAFSQQVDGLRVAFADESTDPNGQDDLTTWIWEFGDGETSHERSPTHTYRYPGEFEVVLTVEDRGGRADTERETISIRSENSPPIANFNSIIDGLRVEFLDSSTDPNGDEDLESWFWVFGDGLTSTERNPVHTYAADGEYLVRLVVVDQAQSADTVERTFVLEAPTIGTAPEIDYFQALPDEVRAGQTALLEWGVRSNTPVQLHMSGIGDVSGLSQIPVRPSDTTTYSLTASNDVGEAVASIEVRVLSSSHTVEVTRLGEGSGEVHATGIACGDDCATAVEYGTLLTLTAFADEGSVVESWSGCDSVDGSDCTIDVRSDRNVTVTFVGEERADPGAGSSLGIVGGSLNGVNLGADRTLTVPAGEPINGTLALDYASSWGSSAVLSIGAAPTWGEPSQTFDDLGNLTSVQGRVTKALSIVAPSEPGTYHVVVAFGAELDAAHVLSMTSRSAGEAIWHDGNDIAAWTDAQILEAMANGRSTGSILLEAGQLQSVTVPATAVTVRVLPQSAPVTIDNDVIYARFDHSSGSIQELSYKEGSNRDVLDQYWLSQHQQGLGRISGETNTSLVDFHVDASSASFTYENPVYGTKTLALAWSASEGVEVEIGLDAPVSVREGATWEPGGTNGDGNDHILLITNQGTLVRDFTYPGAHNRVFDGFAMGSGLWDDDFDEAFGYKHETMVQIGVGEGAAADGPFHQLPAGRYTYKFALKRRDAFWLWLGASPSEPSPTSAEQLVDDFNDGDYAASPAWSIEINDPEIPGTVSAVDEYAHFVRTGAGGNGGSTGIGIVVDIPVTDSTTVEFDAIASSRTVGDGCGWNCGEFPANVELLLEDATGGEYRLRYAVNYGDAVEDRYSADFKQIATSIPQGVWNRGLLFRIRDSWPNVTRITAVRLYGSGWDFDGGIDNITIR